MPPRVLQAFLDLGQDGLLLATVLLCAVLLRNVMFDDGLEFNPVSDVCLGEALVELQELHCRDTVYDAGCL